jgi:hypothetical protein
MLLNDPMSPTLFVRGNELYRCSRSGQGLGSSVFLELSGPASSTRKEGQDAAHFCNGQERTGCRTFLEL